MSDWKDNPAQRNLVNERMTQGRRPEDMVSDEHFQRLLTQKSTRRQLIGLPEDRGDQALLGGGGMLGVAAVIGALKLGRRADKQDAKNCRWGAQPAHPTKEQKESAYPPVDCVKPTATAEQTWTEAEDERNDSGKDKGDEHSR